MSLTVKDVAEITRLLEDSSFTELHLEIDGLKLTLSRQGSGAAAPAPLPAAPPPAAASPMSASGKAAAAAVAELTTTADVHVTVAPLLGTFYRAPKPGSAPFVQVGSAVEHDTIIGIVEVMKLMNTVRAGAKGSVREILATDGVLVEYGQPLLRIDKSA